MEVLLVIALVGWIAVSLVVVGLCIASARGDADLNVPPVDTATRFVRDTAAMKPPVRL